MYMDRKIRFDKNDERANSIDKLLKIYDSGKLKFVFENNC